MVFLTFYLSRDFETVAQRDWHASLCVVVGLLLLQGWPGRASRILSALLCAVALSTRPHALLFLPALASAVIEGARRPRRTRSARSDPIDRAVAGMVPGAGDLRRAGVRTPRDRGHCRRSDPRAEGRRLRGSLQSGHSGYRGHRTRGAARPAGNTDGARALRDAARRGRGASRHRAVTWTLALSAALAYRLFHPVQHAYLAHPLALFSSVAMALPVAWIIERATVPSPLRVLAVLAILVEMSSGVPRYCNPSAAVEAIESLAHGETLPSRRRRAAGAGSTPTRPDGTPGRIIETR